VVAKVQPRLSTNHETGSDFGFGLNIDGFQVIHKLSNAFQLIQVQNVVCAEPVKLMHFSKR